MSNPHSLQNDSASAYHFFEDLGRKVSEVSGDSRERSFTFQRLSVTIQRLNAALFKESFTRHYDHKTSGNSTFCL